MFLKPNDPLLKKVAEEIPKNQINSKSTQKIIETMLKVVQPFMVGLAAPQIGILKRIILVDVKADGKGKVGNLKIYINPKIIWKSKRKEEWYEGCYSTGKICGIVSRSTSITIKAFTMQPRRLPHKLVTEKYTGYVARIFQHEIDHLNGQVFINHIKNPANLHWVEKKEFPLYRNKEAWRNWPKKGIIRKSESSFFVLNLHVKYRQSTISPNYRRDAEVLSGLYHVCYCLPGST
ncbi:MAG: peptide deformylase [Candidatus Daviesbacteria bacterium]|nr:peptide deformylase [Candidatus Daviesbacteria bacterium]